MPGTCVPGGRAAGAGDTLLPYELRPRWRPPLCSACLSSAKDALSPPPKKAVGKEAGGAMLAGAFHPNIGRATTQGSSVPNQSRAGAPDIRVRPLSWRRRGRGVLWGVGGSGFWMGKWPRGKTTGR